jgi:RHS repeat-associated protein
MTKNRLALVIASASLLSSRFVAADDLQSVCKAKEMTIPLETTADNGLSACMARAGGGPSSSDDESNEESDSTDPTASPLQNDTNTPAQTDNKQKDGDPVVDDGEFSTSVTDLSYPGFGINFEFTRSYRGRTKLFTNLGHNWDHSYDRKLYGDAVGHTYCDGSIDYQDGKLGVVHFTPLKSDVIRVVANTFVNQVARVSSPIPLMPHSLTTIAQGLTITRPLPPNPNPTPSPPPLTTHPAPKPQPIDYAASSGATVRLRYDATLPNPWILTELSGVVSYFDNDGHLAVMQHPAGPRMTFTWTNGRLSKVVDTTNRTIYLNYDTAGRFLQCLSADTTCNQPLVSYSYDLKNAELRSVSFPGTLEGTTSYIYDHGHYTQPYVGDDDAQAQCQTMCAARTPMQCRNEDLCHFNKCSTMTGSDPVAAKAACQAYCLSTCHLGLGSKYTTCAKQCDIACANPASVATDCFKSLPNFCQATDCVATCTNDLIVPGDVNGSPHQYHFGVFSDLNHDLVQIIDGDGRTVIRNVYGKDPTDVSFDKIVDQQIGDIDLPENHVKFEYHDLRLEAQGSGSPSKANPAMVVPLESFSSQNICPTSCSPAGVQGCVSPRVQYGAATTDPNVENFVAPHQMPRYATVVYDLGNVVKTNYFDQNWNLLRGVNQTTGEQTDYNYDANGYMIGQQNPAGDRVCQVLQGSLPAQITKLPAPGFPGSQDPIVSTIAYNGAFQPTDLTNDPDGANVRVHYERDDYQRILWVDKSVNTNTTERTTYTYDSGTPFPKSVTTPGGGVTTYANYDPVGAAPNLISVGADGASPIQSYSTFNKDGRVLETGKVNLAATKYQYSVTGRVSVQSRRYDAQSPWVDITSDLAPRGLQPLTTIGPRVKTVVYSNPQGDPVWKGEQPVDGSQPMRYTCFHYDGEHHLLETILPEGNSVVYTYDGQWRPRSTSKGMRGGAPTDAWAQQCAANASNWSGSLETVSVIEYGPSGFAQARTVGGVKTTFVTDGFGRPIEEHAPTGAVARRGFDRQGHVVWEAIMQPVMWSMPYAKPQPDNYQVVSMGEYAFDHLGRTTSVTRYHLEDHTPVIKTVDYRDTQRTVVETETGFTTTSVFDGAGRPVSKTIPDGSTATTQYLGDSGSTAFTVTPTNNPAKPNAVVQVVHDGMGFIRIAYDDQKTVLHTESHDIEGHLISSTDLAGNAVTTYGYDGFGRLQTETRVFDTQPTTTATYGYDRDDRRTRVADARGNATVFAYDGLDRVSVKTDPTGKSASFVYDPGSARILKQTDPSGTVFARTYDQLGRAYTETSSPPAGLDIGARQTTLGYDLGGHLQSVAYGGAGLQGWDNTITMEFDSLGRKVREANSLFSLDVQHGYDLNGRWRTTNIAGSTQQQSFDTLGRLAGVSLNGTSLAVYHYGPSGVGGPLSIDYATGAHTTFAYDARNRQTDLWVTQASGTATNTLISMHTGLGADGVPRQRMYAIGAHRTVANVFQVDKFGRVTGEGLDVPNASSLAGDVTNTQVAPWMQQGTRFRTFTLDGASNWQSWSDNQSGGDSPTVDARNAYTSFLGGQPLYDAADNAISIPAADGNEAYTFDVYKHTLSAAKGSKGASFVYDGLGRRILEHDAAGASYLLWDGSQVVARGDSRTDSTRWTLEVGGADIDEHIASVAALGHGAKRVYHQTVDGSVIGVSDGSGLVEGYTYSSYGEVSTYAADGSSRAEPTARFLYHGQLFDPWTKTYSMRAREYRPAWGRFLSTDPIGLDGGLNLYAFVNGSPLHLRDPMGTDPSSINTLSNWIALANERAAGNMSEADAALFEEMSAIDPKLATQYFGGNEAQAMAALDAYHDAVNGLLEDQLRAKQEQDRLTMGGTDEMAVGKGGVLAAGLLMWLAGPEEAAAGTAVIEDVGVASSAGAGGGATSFFEGASYTEKVVEQMSRGAGEFHSFPESVTAFESSGNLSTITGGDGLVREMLEIPGSYASGKGGWYDGVFQFIKDADGSINHRLFVPNP